MSRGYFVFTTLFANWIVQILLANDFFYLNYLIIRLIFKSLGIDCIAVP